MKLTKLMRSSFVNAVMADVPQTDYQELVIKAIQKEAMANMPADVRKLWDDPDMQNWVRIEHKYNRLASVPVPSDGGFKLSQKLNEEITAWIAADQEQKNTLDKLRGNTARLADSCATREALVKMLPEFEKYMPADEETACKTLPAVTNIMESFVAAGWPADRKA